ncbi:MAG: TM0106 family RecB-like putative nuclease [Candidatus Eiseniibacteriota bacterium]
MLTANHLYQYLSCPRWPWNEWFGDPREKRGPSAFLRKLLADGVQHEEAIYADLNPARVSYPPGDHAAGARETLRLMRAGTPLIAQAVLQSGDRLGIADLLERCPGHSALGDFVYEPIEIKTARSVKTVYRLQLAFYGHLLAEILGVWPSHAHVILNDGSRESFSLDDVRGPYERVLAGLEGIADGAEAPIHICSTCAECPWELACLGRAETARDVSLTYGLQRRAARALREHGIHTLDDLAGLSAPTVTAWTGVAPGDARTLVAQAGVLVHGEAQWRHAPGFDASETDLYFDIEGDPEHDVMYLFGVLSRGRDGSEGYHAFVAEEPGDEGRAFRELLDHFESFPGAPIYHYHHYERSALRALSEKHGVDPARVPVVLERMRDLNRDLTASVVLPVYSYSLKAVARFLGYEWAHPEASAAQSMFWYSAWLKSGDRSFLECAVEYNRDDCRATGVLKEWLSRGPQKASPAPFASSAAPGYAGLRGVRPRT